MTDTAERETELVAGVIGDITQKKADTWTVGIQVDGLQSPKNLWTKDKDLIESLATKIGQSGAFVCNASYWTRDDQQVRSLWIDSVENADAVEAVRSVATPDAAPKVAGGVRQGIEIKPAGEVMSKEEWARKDSAAHKRACIAIAVSALGPKPREQTLAQYNEDVLVLALGWHRSVLAERDDPAGEDVPF